MKSLANYISFSRIIFSLTLLLIKPLTTPFCIIYIICGLSDMIDGSIARRTGTASKLGERLDSIADLVMAGVLLFVLYPIINPTAGILIWVISIAVVRLASMLVALKKYKTFAVLHTWGNKATGLVIFIFPLFLPLIHIAVLMYSVCAVASISAVEELIIQLTANELQANRKSIFVK